MSDPHMTDDGPDDQFEFDVTQAPHPEDPFTPADEPVAVVEDVDGAATDGFVVQDGQLIGDPVGDSQHWFEQAANGFCVPSSVAQVVSAFTGRHFADEQDFVQAANELNVFTVGPDGVPSMDVQGAQTLLDAAGVPSHIEVSDLDGLADHLADGHKIILAIDSGEVWGTDTPGVEDQAPDHAVVLTGIDVVNGTAILSDPGSPDGNLETVPLDVLADAWADSGNTMVVTDTAPPADGGAGLPVPGAEPETVLGASLVPPEPGVLDGIGKFIGDHPVVLVPVVVGLGMMASKASNRK
ncbi:C39 family peptidase [Actinoplanes sp. NPDC051470]|uniref:C39 family peptidase n=1 Tax=unclassified Actinoplanes TaxID=2626549 RepID=UPI00343B7E3F